MKLEELCLPNGEFVEIKSENSQQDSNYYTVLIGANGVGKTRIFESMLGGVARRYEYADEINRFSKIIFSTYTLFNRKILYKGSHYIKIKNKIITSNFTSKTIVLEVSKMYTETKLYSNTDNQRFSKALKRLSNLLGINENPRLHVEGLSGLNRKVLERKIEKIELESFEELVHFEELLKNRLRILDNPDIIANKLSPNNNKRLADYKTNDMKGYLTSYCYCSLLTLKLALMDNRERNQSFNSVQNIYTIEELVKLYCYYFEIGNPDDGKELLRLDYQICQLLKINFISDLAFELKDENSKFCKISNFSSGQFAIFTRILELAISIGPDSLILIDEPETFLNPKWVFEFVGMLKDIFKNMDCHFIIASQSPFVVGSVKKEDIIKLRKNNEGEVFAEGVESQTLGATFDDILANVFGVDFSDNKVADDYKSKIEVKAKGDILEAFEMLPDLAESREKMHLVLRLSSPENKERIKAKIKELEERYFGEQRGHSNQRDT